MESVTSWSPYHALQQFRTVFYDKPLEYRMGFMRAYGSTGHPIYFGMTMFVVTGLLVALRGFAQPRWLWYASLAGSLAGVASSLSSGPYVATGLLAVFMCFAYRPAY